MVIDAEALLVHDGDGNPVSPAMVLRAYRLGMFPMADSPRDPFRWYQPFRRAVITPDTWHVSASLRRFLRKDSFRIEFDRDFAAVVRGCADRADTWINPDIEKLYRALHDLGHAHSVAVYEPDGGELVGGLYGLAIGRCFSGESMFHRASNASKVAMVALTERLWSQGFLLHDCQQMTPVATSFGAYEISNDEYQGRLIACGVASPAL